MNRDLLLYAQDVLTAFESGKSVWQVCIHHLPTGTYISPYNRDDITKPEWISISTAKNKSKKQLQEQINSWIRRQNKCKITDIQQYTRSNGTSELYFSLDLDSLISNWWYELHDNTLDEKLVEPYILNKISAGELVGYAVKHSPYALQFSDIPLSDIFTLNIDEFDFKFRCLNSSIKDII